jgi:hypothetical protein
MPKKTIVNAGDKKKIKTEKSINRQLDQRLYNDSIIVSYRSFFLGAAELA